MIPSDVYAHIAVIDEVVSALMRAANPRFVPVLQRVREQAPAEGEDMDKAPPDVLRVLHDAADSLCRTFCLSRERLPKWPAAVTPTQVYAFVTKLEALVLDLAHQRGVANLDEVATLRPVSGKTPSHCFARAQVIADKLHLAALAEQMAA